MSASTSVVWFKPLSKFVLEVSPLVSALLIGAYLVSGAQEGTAPAVTQVALPEPDTAMLPGEAVTAMIKDAHAAIAVENRARQAASTTAAALPPAPAASPGAPHVAKPAAKVALTPKAMAKPAAATVAAETPAVVASSAAVAPVAAVAAAPQPLAPPEPEHGVIRRTWSKVAGWSGTVAHATRIDYAAGVVTETPSAVARAGRKTWQTLTSFLPDESHH